MSRVPTNLAWGRIVRALKKARFVVAREGKHTSMTKDDRLVIIPRHPRIKRETLRGIIEDAGLTLEESHELI